MATSLAPHVAGESAWPGTPSCVSRLNAGWSRIHAMVDCSRLLFFHASTNALDALGGAEVQNAPVLKLTCAHALSSLASAGDVDAVRGHERVREGVRARLVKVRRAGRGAT